ncbi:MAG: phosphotransferase [Desulfococcus multivorans]|jgi:hypothetical protein|nr:phosphotransferase [Desulfococcus multivorans]
MYSSNKKTELFFFGLPPSNPRILIPIASPAIQAGSFGLYSPCSIQGKIFKWLGKIAVRVGVLHMVGCACARPVEAFKTTETLEPILKTQIFNGLQNDWKAVLGRDEIFFAMSLGEPNLYRKATALIFDKSEKPVAFAKVAGTDQAKALIANEAAALDKMSLLGCRSLAAPCFLGQGKTENISWILQTPLLRGRPSPNKLHKEHHAFLAEIAQRSIQTKVLEEDSFVRFISTAHKRPALPMKTEFESERDFVEKLYYLLKAQNFDVPWPFTIAHGDFAPWNMRLVDGRLGLFDWEYCMPVAPAGWDLFYFVFRVDNLIKRHSLEQLWRSFESGAYQETISVFEQAAGLMIPDKKFLAMMVLLALAFDFPAKKIAEVPA